MPPYVYGRTPNRLRMQLIDWLRTVHTLLDEFNCARDIYEAPEGNSMTTSRHIRYDARILTNCGGSENREPSMTPSGRSLVLGTWRSGTLQY